MNQINVIVSFTFSVNFDISSSMISSIEMTEILSILISTTFFVSLCSTFGICLFWSFLMLGVILMFHPLLYFQSIKLYFDWICYANLSLKWIALVDLIEFSINFLDKFIWYVYNFKNKTFFTVTDNTYGGIMALALLITLLITLLIVLIHRIKK